ncbi:MAG: hypothetical protein ABSG36_13555 [Acidimicrobiales bacterium]
MGAFGSKAEARQWATAEAEITKNSEFGANIGQFACRVLLQISPRSRWEDRAWRAASVLKSFSFTLRPDDHLTRVSTLMLQRGLADSCDLSEEGSDLFVALGEAAQAHGTGVVFIFDEVQFLGIAQSGAFDRPLLRPVSLRGCEGGGGAVREDG